MTVTEQRTSEYVEALDINLLAPDPLNPRKTVDIDDGFRDSIAAGIIEPLIVRPVADDAGRYLLVAGERRYTAALEVHLDTVPAIVRHDLADNAAALELMLTENGQRNDLAPLEEAAAYQQLVELGRSQRQIASKVGRKQGTVSKRLSLLRLPGPAQALLSDKRISVQTALGMTGLLKDRGRLDNVLDVATHTPALTDADIAAHVFKHLDAIGYAKQRAEAEATAAVDTGADTPADKIEADITAPPSGAEDQAVDEETPSDPNFDADATIASAARDYVAARHAAAQDPDELHLIVLVDSAWEHLRLACGYSHADFDEETQPLSVEATADIATIDDTVAAFEPPWANYDGWPPKTIIRVLAREDTDRDRIEAVIAYEQAHGQRAPIIDFARERLAAAS